MNTWIILLRGINVGGRNSLPMKELVQILESLGLENIQTYIQSGNVVFQTQEDIPPGLMDEIADTIEERYGFWPQTLLFSSTQLELAIANNPYPEAEAEPRTLHLFFLASQPEEPDIQSLNEAKAPSERFHLGQGVFYLHAPDGIGRSKLAANAEKYLGVPATARNWRTVQKLREMVQKR